MNEQIRQEADAFFLQGSSEVGVVLVHGYTGAPSEMCLLGKYLHEQGGYTVFGVRMAGHGTNVKELEQTTWPDWYKAVEEGVKKLNQRCRHVYIAGQSMGGLLAIKAAAEFSEKRKEKVNTNGTEKDCAKDRENINAKEDVKRKEENAAKENVRIEKLALLATPIFLRDKRVPFVKLLRFLIPRIKTGQHSYDVPEKYMQGYSEMPTKPVISLLELIKLCKVSYLKTISVPTLIVQGKMDHTVKPESATYIYERLQNVPASQKEILWLQNSRHVVTLDAEREEVYAACLRFFEKGEGGVGKLYKDAGY